MEGFEFSLEGLYNAFQSSENLILQTHGTCEGIVYPPRADRIGIDMELRTINPSVPYQEMTMGQFIKEIDDPHAVKVALEFPPAQHSIPFPFK